MGLPLENLKVSREGSSGYDQNRICLNWPLSQPADVEPLTNIFIFKQQKYQGRSDWFGYQFLRRSSSKTLSRPGLLNELFGVESNHQLCRADQIHRRQSWKEWKRNIRTTSVKTASESALARPWIWVKISVCSPPSKSKLQSIRRTSRLQFALMELWPHISSKQRDPNRASAKSFKVKFLRFTAEVMEQPTP
jgi:hypothetical protein